ncbi:MAG: GNAT family N-acetyltransferase [Oscillospiraceae bacterium]|nr:GNAT family N-acetyltransferase [Oscillospiraceae bacterium]
MIIRRFENKDAEKVSSLIIHTVRISNIEDYSAELMEELIKHQQAENVLERAGWTHFYVAQDGNEIIGCGAIGPYWGKEDESSLFTIFVLPEYQGKGIGTKIIETLEKDEYFLRSKRIEIPSSITAVNFYRKFGYNYKNGIAEIDEEQIYRLEKFR